MASHQLDAVSSFVYLTDNIPSWLDRLANLTKHAAQKNAEFVADYAKVVSGLRPKRIKSPSLQSVHSDKDPSIHTSQIDAQNENALPTPPQATEINPLEAGTKYLYAQAQKKRKPDGSIRSGASGPQKFRSKNQVIVYYDAYLQAELDSMVKALGVARNNLRKGRNALTASRGFQLPALSRRYDAAPLAPSLDKTRCHPISPPTVTGKYNLRSCSQAPVHEEEACFTDVDQMLEGVQGLYETAAHQFLRDGDCKAELESAQTSLTTILGKAKWTVEVLTEKAKRTEETITDKERESKDTDSETTLNATPSTEHLNPVFNKAASTSLSQTLEDLKVHAIMSAPALITAAESPLLTSAMTIEVDDDASEDGSLADLDISQYRLNNTRPLRV